MLACFSTIGAGGDYYGYDYNSNRQWQEDPVAAAASINLDMLYAYDGLNRLTAYDRGDINGTHTAITTLAFAQDWNLDQLNNWSGFDEDTNGNGTNDLVQARTHNDANEITAITASTGANWVDPTYDAAGNMITGPTPGAETATQKYIYDAWNRLVKVTDGSDVTVLTYGYDARSFRITKGVYTSGSLSQTRHYYHSEQNQVVEERVDSSSNPDRQYTWGDRYVDDLVLRTRDTDANGSLDETLYALSDSNWSITALTDTSGAVVERFRYDAYGKPLVLDPNFATDADGISDYAWEYRFTSREWDVESKLHYFRARYYDDAGGRFLQRDPIGYVDGMSLYAGHFIPSSDDPTGNKKKSFGPNDRNDLRNRLSRLCEKCVVGDVNQNICYGLVDRLANQVLKDWNKSFSNDPKDHEGDLVGGYLCWDWADMFEDIGKHIDPDGDMICSDRRKIRKMPRPSKGADQHHFTRFCVGGDCDRSACCVEVDDGYFRDGFVHDPGWWAKGKGWEEAPDDAYPESNFRDIPCCGSDK